MPTTLHDLYSLEIDEVPGLVPELGENLDNADITLQIFSSVARPPPGSKRKKKEVEVKAPDLGPTQLPCALSLEDLDERYVNTCKARHQCTQQLQDKLKRQSLDRASSRATTRMSSRSTRASSGLSTDFDGSRASTAFGPSPETSLSGTSGAKNPLFTERRSGYVPAVWPFPEPIPNEAPSKTVKKYTMGQPWHLKPTHDPNGVPYAPAVWPFPEPIPYETPSRVWPRRYPEANLEPCVRQVGPVDQKQIEFAAAATAHLRKAEIEDADFMMQNRHLADSWMRMCKRSEYDQAWLLESEKEIWVQTKNERKKALRERKQTLRRMHPMPFEDWLEDQISGSGAGVRLHDFNRAGESQEEQERMRNILRNLASDEYRGKIEREDRLAAQNHALATLKRQCQKGTDFESLATEVRNGMCILVEPPGGLLQRVVALLTIHLERAGKLLAEVAHVSENEIKAQCKLPAARQLEFEPAKETLMRELSSTFAPFGDAIQLNRIEVEDHRGKSEFCGLSSIYRKTVQYAQMDTLLPMPSLPIAMPKDKDRVPLHFQKNTVFALMQGGKIRLYTWLAQDVFTHLSSDEGRKDLVQWIDLLEINEMEAKHELAWTKNYHKPSMTNTLCNSLLRDMKTSFAAFRKDNMFENNRVVRPTVALSDAAAFLPPQPQLAFTRADTEAMLGV